MGYVHVDHLNRPKNMTNASKASVWDVDWAPWGAPYAITGSATLDARFPGQWYQMEAGLHYNWHRHYDPTLGRYTQPDPLGFVDGPNVYAYVKSSPGMWVDPDGRYMRRFPHVPSPGGDILIPGPRGGGGSGRAPPYPGPSVDLTPDPDDDRSIPEPKCPRKGCTCTCRADANDNIPGNVNPNKPKFALGTATAHSCSAASKQAKRIATHALGAQPKHLGCRCSQR
jgi:RHS repeat-associated protein